MVGTPIAKRNLEDVLSVLLPFDTAAASKEELIERVAILNRRIEDLDARLAYYRNLEGEGRLVIYPESNALLDSLAQSMTEIYYNKGDHIIESGEDKPAMYFIINGEVNIQKDIGGPVLATLSHDTYFGENGILISHARDGSVIVHSETCQVHCLMRASFEKEIQKYPDIMDLVQQLSEARTEWMKRMQETEGSNEFGGEFATDIGRKDLSKISLFEGADNSAIRALASELSPEVYQPGDIIVRKGDDANEMFLVLHGKVEVVSDDQNTVYASMSSGSFFGEVGVLLKTKRTACVRAHERTLIFRLMSNVLARVSDKFPKLQELLRSAADERYALFQKRSEINQESTLQMRDIDFEINQQNLQKVGIFSRCDRNVLAEIASTMTLRAFQAGETIIACGSEVGEMLFLAYGTADIYSEFNELLDTSDAGTYFGEVGILHDLPRIASVRARTHCTAYVLTRMNLLECLEKFPDSFKAVQEESQKRLQNYLMRNVLA